METERREPTDEERAALLSYSGWGGAADAFASEPTGRWRDIQVALSGILTDDELAAARASTLTAFYTPAPVVAAIYGHLSEMGFGASGDAVLEPGCGTGNFMAVSEAAGLPWSFTGVELDPVSARIAAALHPGAHIVNASLERCDVPQGSFEAVVGNVPYSDAVTVRDGGRTLPIHDYFLIASTRALRPGGVMAALTSRYTLDKSDTGTRTELLRSCELICAYRLPRETFRAQAGTEAVSDLIYLRRRERSLTDEELAAEQARLRGTGADWISTGELADEPGVRVNSYIAARPERSIGTMHGASGPYGRTLVVESGLDADGIGAALASEERTAPFRSLARAHEEMEAVGARQAAPSVRIRPEFAERFEYALSEDGGLFYGSEGEPARVELPNPRDLDRLSAMVSLRDSARALLALEARPDAANAEVDEAIAALDADYDAFTSRFGRICEPVNRRLWNSGGRRDVSLAQIEALEVVKAGVFDKKAEILSRRVVSPVPDMPEHVDEAGDALAVSLDRKGAVDLDLIAGLLGLDSPAAALDALGELVVTDPDTGAPLLASAYLSGNVPAKLVHLRDLIAAEADAPVEAERIAWLREQGVADALAADERASSNAKRLTTSLRRSGEWERLADPQGASSWALVKPDWDEWRDYGAAPLIDLLAERKDGSSDLVEFAPTSLLGFKATSKAAHALLGLEEHRCPELVRTGGYLGWRTGAAPAEEQPSLARSWARVAVCLAQPGRSLSGPEAAALMCEAFGGRLSDENRDAIAGKMALAASAVSQEAAAAVEALRVYTAARGYAQRETRDPAAAAAAAETLAEHPELFEYLAATARAAFGSISAEGMDAFARRRKERLDAAAETVDAGRAAALRALAARLEAAAPPPLAAGEVSMPLGAAWIPPREVWRFAVEVFADGMGYRTEAQQSRLTVSHDDESGEWEISFGGFGALTAEVDERFGTPERKPFQLLQAVLNNAKIEVRKPDPDDPAGKRTVRDAPATALAQEKAREIRRAWDGWLEAEPSRREELARVYNDRFNNLTPRTYDGQFLTLPGKSASIELRDYQKDAIARALSADEGTLVAHVVGAGKTLELIGATMEARRLGKCSKPLIAVPNHLTGQWRADFLTLYPRARVLAMEREDTRNADALRRFWARAASGTWDAVIVGQSRFDRLPMSTEYQRRHAQARLDELTNSIAEAQARGADFTVKSLERIRARVKARLERLEGERTEGATFESLGIDMLVVDEAHNYKNLAIATSMDVAGITGTSSAKCEALLEKCDWLRERGLGSNLLFATGTPVSNTMSELYNMQRYLAPNLLREQGVSSFTAWAGTFGEIVSKAEVRPEGNGFQVKSRFARFHNLPELMGAFHAFADIKTASDLDLKVPEVEVVPVVVDATPEQENLVRQLAERAERIRSGSVNPHSDNMLKITSEGRKLALDPKLLAPDDDSVEPMEGGKVAACAETVARVFFEEEEHRGTQIVFCDTSTPASGTWNVYDDLRRRLIELGVPEDQIAMVQDAGDNPDKRDELFRRVDEGEVRILLGSTQKLGTGTNVQTHLAATHDLDCPWRPADLEQRQGRIRRSGNRYDRVRNFRYVVNGTFDAYLYQTVERKQQFISQVVSSSCPARSMEEIDEVTLSYAQIKALATGDPTVQRIMELENDIAGLELMRTGHDRARDAARVRARELREQVALLEESVAQDLADAPFYADALSRMRAAKDANSWRMEVAGRVLTDRHDASDAIAAHRAEPRLDRHAEVGELYGIKVCLACKKLSQAAPDALALTSTHIAVEHAGRLRVFARALSPQGSGEDAVRQLERLVENLAKGPVKPQERLARKREELASVERAADAPFPAAGRLADLKRELDALRAERAPDDTVDAEQNASEEIQDTGRVARRRPSRR